MTAPWTVDLAVAGNSWTVTNLDPATPGPAAPLTLRHALPDDQLWPSQPLPMVATFGLVVASAAELVDVVEGADVHIAFTAPPNPDPVYFDGDVSDVEIDPVRFRPDPDDPTVVDGVRVSVTAIGYLAQLWEEPTTIDEGNGDPDNNGTSFAFNRLNAMFTGEEAAAPPPFTWPDEAPDMVPVPNPSNLAPSWLWNQFPLTSMAPLNVAGEAMGPHIDAILRVRLWATSPTGDVADLLPPKRIILEANVDPVTRALESPNAWKAALVSNQVPVPAAADLELTPTGWGVVVDPDAGGAVISAGRVERDIRFVQRKRANVSRVIVPYFDSLDAKVHSLSSTNGKTPTVQATLPGEGGDLPATARLPTNLVDGSGEYPDTPNHAIRRVADFYLPEGHVDAWGVDTVTWRLDRDTAGRTPPALGSLVVIAGVPESQNPNGRTWVSGIVKSWTLTLPDATVELDLLPSVGKEVPDPAGDRLTWAELPAGVTWDQLRPDHTWADADLLRGP